MILSKFWVVYKRDSNPWPDSKYCRIVPINPTPKSLKFYQPVRKNSIFLKHFLFSQNFSVFPPKIQFFHSHIYLVICKCFRITGHFNTLPDMPILGFSNSAPNKDTLSKIWTDNYGDTIIWLGRKHCGKRRNCSLWENIVGKGEIARYEQFLLFPQCFQKLSVASESKGVSME